MTLGWHEQHDVGTLVTHLIAQGHKKVRRGCDHIPESHCRRRPTCSSSKPTPFGNLGRIVGSQYGGCSRDPLFALVGLHCASSCGARVGFSICEFPEARGRSHQKGPPCSAHAIPPTPVSRNPPTTATPSQPFPTEWLSSYRARSACRALLCVQS